MAKDPAFLFYPGDYLRDTQTLSEKSQVAYDRIMCEHMRNICITKQQLKFFTKRLSEDEIEELKFVLTEIKGGYQIEWVAESIIKRKEYSNSRRKNREGKKKNISKTYDLHMENENENINIIKNINIVFETFWNLYDKKVGDKNKIEKIWNKLTNDERDLIINYIPEYKESQPNKQYRKNPQTFLLQRGWLDEIIENNNNQEYKLFTYQQVVDMQDQRKFMIHKPVKVTKEGVRMYARVQDIKKFKLKII